MSRCLRRRTIFGGRIHTVKGDGLTIELGAEFLHGESQTIASAIEAAGLSTHTISDDYQIFQNGHFKRVNLLDKMSKIIHRINIRHHDHSFEDFLDTQMLHLDDRNQAIGFVEGFHAAHPDSISAHSIRRGEYAAEHMRNTKQGRINEGYGALVDFLEAEIRAHGGKLVTNAAVEKVRWQPGHVEVAFHHGDHEILKADAAVITLPLGVLKANSVEFQPPLAVKQEAIEQLQFGNVVKVIFQFRERWWPPFGFMAAPDEVFPTWWTDPRLPILTGWAGGPKADLLLKYSSAQLKQFGLKTLALIFPEHAEEIPAAIYFRLYFRLDARLLHARRL